MNHSPALTRQDKCEAFRLATDSFAKRYKEQITQGMDDSELETP